MRKVFFTCIKGKITGFIYTIKLKHRISSITVRYFQIDLFLIINRRLYYFFLTHYKDP